MIIASGPNPYMGFDACQEMDSQSSEGAGGKRDLETPAMHWMGLAVSCPNGLRALPDATLVRHQAARAEQAVMAGKVGPLYTKASSALFREHGTSSHRHSPPPEQSFRE